MATDSDVFEDLFPISGATTAARPRFRFPEDVGVC